MKFTEKEIETIIEALKDYSTKKSNPDISKIIITVMTADSKEEAEKMVKAEGQRFERLRFENLEFEVFCKSLILKINANKSGLTHQQDRDAGERNHSAN